MSNASQKMNDQSNIIGLLSSIRKTVYLHESGTILNLCSKFLFMHRIQTSDKTILLASGVKDFRATECNNIIFVSGTIQHCQVAQDQSAVQMENVSETQKTHLQSTHEVLDQITESPEYECFQFDLIGEFVYNYHTFPDVKVHCYNEYITAMHRLIPQILIDSTLDDQKLSSQIYVNDLIRKIEYTIDNVDGNVTGMRVNKRYIYVILEETKLIRYSLQNKQIEDFNQIIVPNARIQDILFRDNNIFILQKREDLTVITCVDELTPYKNIVQRTVQSAQLVSYGERLCYKLISGHYVIVELTKRLKIEHMYSMNNGIGIFYCMNRLRGSRANSIYASDFV